MKKTIPFLIALLLCGCSPKTVNEMNASQTPATVVPEADQIAIGDNADYITAQSDGNAFVLELTEKLTAKGWIVRDIQDYTFGVTTPTGGIYLIQYDYESEEVNRVVVYSVWTGVGTSNLESDVLSIVNQVNYEQFLAKVSVDQEGNFWLETTITFGKQLDVNYFCDYLNWFEDNETSLLLSYFQDYLKQSGN